MSRLVWWLVVLLGVVVVYLCVQIVLVPEVSEEDSPASISAFKGFDILFLASILENTSHEFCTHGAGSWGDHKGDLRPVVMGTSCNNTTPIYANKTKRFLEYETHLNGTTYGSCWGDMNKDGWDDVVLVGKGPDRIYYNKNGTFKLDKSLHVLSEAYGDGQSCILIDLNHDGYLDIVRVGTRQTVAIFQFDRKGFVDVTNATGLPRTMRSFVAIGNLPKPHLALISTQDLLEIYDIRHLPYLNVTDKFSGIPRNRLVSAKLHDMDNDKNFDLVLLPADAPPVVCFNLGNFGFFPLVLPTPKEPHESEDIALDLAIGDFNNDMLPDVYVVRKIMSNITNIVYMNQGAGSFKTVYGTSTPLSPGPVIVEAIDYNFDGYVDLSVFSSGGVQLFENTHSTRNNWLQIELVPEGYHSVSGTMVRVKANGVIQQRVVLGSSHSYKRLHFGLGNATVVDEIEVFWFFFAGISYKFYGFAPNQLLTLTLPLAMFEPPARAFEVIHQRDNMNLVCPVDHFRLKPGFLILGIWKAGTTSLAGTLATHPQVVEASRKEIFYYSKYNLKLSPEWYWSQFPCTNNTKLVSFEATAGYLYNTAAPPLIRSQLKDPKFIVMLREPVERMYSHYYMNTRDERDLPRKFDEHMRARLREFQNCPSFQSVCLNTTNSTVPNLVNASLPTTLPTPGPLYNYSNLANESTALRECRASLASSCGGNLLSAGFYYHEISRWFEFFPRKQFKFIHYNDFVGVNASLVVEDVQRFLGLDVIPMKMVAKNISPKRQPMWNSTKTMLQQFFKPYNEMLYHLVQDYGWDST